MTEHLHHTPAPKRLVICCDGTWNAPDNTNITNIEKVARSLQTDAAASGGVQQLVDYIAGVGIGYKLDRLVGGAFGFGVFSNVRMAYRFLALNYEPGDEIFIFGFSRGAYTARSLAGMVGHVGLLTRKGLVHGTLRESLDRYKTRDRPPKKPFKMSLEDFRANYCHRFTPITFIGVFDTVGALGVPGSILRPEHEFHDIDLGNHVQCARHAVAIDERRMTFAPCLWTVPPDKTGKVTVGTGAAAGGQVDRVKQVWFQGVHSDVGGGYSDCGLSNTTLLWMTDEAKAAGLVFDEELLASYVDAFTNTKLNKSLTFWYRIINIRERIRPRRAAEKNAFTRGLRNLEPPVLPPEDPDKVMLLPVQLASTTREDFDADTSDYRPDNLASFVTLHTPPKPGVDAEAVLRLPRHPDAQHPVVSSEG